MSMQTKDDLEAVLRTLALARAQLRALKYDLAQDPTKETEVRDIEVAIDLLLKKLHGLMT
jgi:hypothetical protein